MQVWNVLHAARWKCRTQKWRKKSPSRHHRTTLPGYIFAIKALIDNRKNLSSSNMFSRGSHNMVNFGPLTAEIGSGVWGTPVNCNSFRVLAALLPSARHSSSGRQPNFAALNRGRHLYSAGRPSRWTLAYISSSKYIGEEDTARNSVYRLVPWLPAWSHVINTSTVVIRRAVCTAVYRIIHCELVIDRSLSVGLVLLLLLVIIVIIR